MAAAILPGVVVSLDAPEWGRGAVATGVAATGAAAIGAAAIGMATIGTTTGMAIGTAITITIILSSSATSVFPVGGAGAGAGILTGVTPITDTMITATPTVTTAMEIPATDTAIMGMETAMDMATGIVDNTALLPGQK